MEKLVLQRTLVRMNPPVCGTDINGPVKERQHVRQGYVLNIQPIKDQVVLACVFDDLAVENDYICIASLLLLLCVTAVDLCDRECVSTRCGRAHATLLAMRSPVN